MRTRRQARQLQEICYSTVFLNAQRIEQRVRSFGKRLKIPTKGSRFRRRLAKGLHFWARARQNQERVRAFGEDPQRVRTFGHALAENAKGFALLAKARKGFALVGTRSVTGGDAQRGAAKGSHSW